jgi:putative transposase
LKPVYRAANAEAAASAPEGIWGRKYPAIAQSWRRNWEAVIRCFAFPAEVRKIIYTTNFIESLNASVRKAVRNKGTLPERSSSDKLIWLAVRHITENWKNPPISWHAAKTQLAIQFEDRFVLSE